MTASINAFLGLPCLARPDKPVIMVSVLRSALEADDGHGRYIDYHRIHRVLAEGNFVLCVSEGNYGGAHSSFYDLFQLAAGKVVEHWDTTEMIAPRNEWKNDNGKF